MAELWFDDLEAADAAFASPVGQTTRADADAHVSRLERLHLTSTRSSTIPRRPASSSPRASKRRADMSREAFGHWWLEAPRALRQEIPRCRSIACRL